MAKKNLDLSDYSVQNNAPAQTKSKYSAFMENEETHLNENTEAQNNPETQEADNHIEPNSDVSEGKESRVNMAFPDSNYEFLLSETSKLNINVMHFLNLIISSTTDEEIKQFIDNHPWLKGGRSSAPRRRGHKMKRINFKLSTQNHEKLRTCASNNNATITNIVNAILEIYIAKNNLSTI